MVDDWIERINGLILEIEETENPEFDQVIEQLTIGKDELVSLQ